MEPIMFARRIFLSVTLLGLFGLFLAFPSRAGEVEVVAAKARLVQSGAASVWRFEVTLRHADAGWNHYSDSWEILAPDGKLLGRRVLLHPHVGEQPFTRSLWLACKSKSRRPSPRCASGATTSATNTAARNW